MAPSAVKSLEGGFRRLVDVFNEQRKKKLSEHQGYGTDVYVSNFEGMELTDYIKVATFVCAEKHQPAGSLCSCEG